MQTMNETKPKREKKQYDEAFRRRAVALLESSGRPLKELAAELGVTHWNLRDWTKKHGRNRPVAAATPAAPPPSLTQPLSQPPAVGGGVRGGGSTVVTARKEP